MKELINVIFNIKNKDLSSEKFFEEVINICMEEKLISDKEAEKIMYRRMELMQEKLRYYTLNESSSIMKEEAENILLGIDYTIGLYLKGLSSEVIIKKLKGEDLGNLLKKGEDLIKEKVKKNEIIFHHIKESKLNVNNYSYDDTIEYGLSVFFAKYDVFFKPHETPCSIDYQLPIDIMGYTGIEYMEKYQAVISYENEFCNKFEGSNIKRLLKNYDRKYEELLINIFELVFMNAIGRVICNKDFKDLILNDNDILQIQYEYKGLSQEEAVNRLKGEFKKCLDLLSIDNERLFNYGVSLLEKEKEYIYRNIKNETLKSIFITASKESENEAIKYVDGSKLNDDKFRKYTEEIRSCSLVEDKINIINSKFKSLEDIVDMLEAECLFGEEYAIYFKSVEEIYIVLLWKVFKEKYAENYSREWCMYLKKYMYSLSKEKKRNIENIVKEIEL